jgi:endonuclease YncB( thermonuclease family)
MRSPWLAGLALSLVALAHPAFAAACRWREPARTFPMTETWLCSAYRWADGDTLTARCQGRPGPVRIRLRGVDTVERGDPRWRASRAELRRRTEDADLFVRPHHMHRQRVVADVLVGRVNVGQAMHGGGWSKRVCPRL